MSGNLVIYLIPPRYLCKVDNFLFKIAASLFGRWWNFPILGIPTISLVDTNCDPDLANISIPANDDTMTSIRLILNKLVFAISEGRSLYIRNR